MKVYISKYRSHWISPYTIIEKVFFWKDWENISYETPWVERLSNILLPFSNGWLWFADKIHPRVEYVKIDDWDTWSADHTLALIIVPVLKKLQEDKHGSPYVDDEDVPDHLKKAAAPPLTADEENMGTTNENFHKRWEWILSEMIWAFEQSANDDWEDQFFAGKDNFDLKETWDKDGYQKHYDRMANGRRLFAKYYGGLWT